MRHLKIKEERDLVHTLRTQYRTESVIADLSKSGESNTLSEESKKKDHLQIGKSRMIWRWRSFYAIQGPSCAKYWPERLSYGTCGTCLRPSKEQKRKTKEQFEVLSIPHDIVKKNYSRGAKHGPSQEQYDHFKANESTRHAKKKNNSSITERFQKDELYRNSQLAIGFRSWRLVSRTRLRGKSVSDMRTIPFFLASMVKVRGLNQWKKGRFSTSRKQTSVSEKTSGESNSGYP